VGYIEKRDSDREGRERERERDREIRRERAIGVIMETCRPRLKELSKTCFLGMSFVKTDGK
jgi:hypothetical protein